MNSSDVDRIVMAISSLNFTMNEAHESNQKSCENKQRTHESKLKILKELHDSNKTQAAEPRKHEEAILNGIEQMGTNIVKAINPEITVMLSHADVLNQAALDTIMKQLHVISHNKETPKSPDTNYSTMTSEDPQSSQPKTKIPLPKKDESPEDRTAKMVTGYAKLTQMKRPEMAFHPPDHPGDRPTGQTPVAVAEVEEVVAVDDDHQITMIRTKVQIQTTRREQKTTLTQKGRVKAPLSTSPTHPQGTTGERSTHPGGTKIPHMGKC